MPKDLFCIQYTNCTGCPNVNENILVYRNLPKGAHIPKDKCTQNCMLFMIKGELLINSEEYREWGQSEPGYRNDQKTLRRAGDHTGRVFRHRGVQGSGAGDPVTLPTILGFAGTIRHQETSFFRG